MHNVSLDNNEGSKRWQENKNDKRDSKEIAECLCNGGFSAVHIPTPKDNAIKEFIKCVMTLNSIKNQLNTNYSFMYT